MKILLVNPPRYHRRLYSLRDEICFQDVPYVPFPIRLAQAAALLQQVGGCEVEAVDANAGGMSWDELESALPPADLVIVQSAAGLIAHDLRVAETAKENGAGKVALIENVVAPVFPREVLRDFPDLDIIIRGQPEAVVPSLARDLADLRRVRGICFRENGKVTCTPLADRIADMDSLPFMAYDLFPPERYSIAYLDAPMHERIVPGIRMRTTRDCPYGCPFCLVGSSEKRGYTRKWQAMSPARVVEEVEHVVREHGTRGVFFWDETFTLDKKRAAEICDRLIERRLGIEWRCLTRMDCVDGPLLRKMARAGCKLIEYGVESGDESVRRELHKGFGDDEAVEVVRATQRAGIRANCDIIVGMPWETRKTLRRSLALARRLGADNVHLTMAFPLPETTFHDMARREGLIEVDDLYKLMVHQRVRVGAKPVVRTRSLSSAELEAGWREVRRKINRHYLVRNLLLRPWEAAGVLRAAREEGSVLRLIPKAVKFAARHLTGRAVG